MENFILPAYNTLQDGIHISKEDFQEQLNVWLERNGMLDELRGHFRTNLFKILKNTPVGRTFTSRRQSAVSLKDRALILLISECLYKLGCHFALSVFCVEAPLEKSVQEKFSTSNGKIGEWKFSPKDVYDIITSLGVTRSSDYSLTVSSVYFDGGDSLLSCMLSLCDKNASYHDIPTVAPKALTVQNDYNIFINNIETILLSTNISPGQLVDVRKCVSRFLNSQNEDVLKVKEEYRKHLSKYKLKISAIRKTLDDERMKVYKEFVKAKRKGMDNENKNVARGECGTNKFCDDVNKIGLKYKVCETSVTSKGNFNNMKMDDVKFVDKILQTDVTEDNMVVENKSKFHHTFQTIVTENNMMKESLTQLQEDNATLKLQNENYMKQMKELSNRAVILINELDNSQQEIIRLKNYIETLRMNTFAKRRGISPNGTGEQCTHVQLPTRPKTYKYLFQDRRCDSEANCGQFSSSTEEATSSDEVLLEAKRRLRNLELESENIDARLVDVSKCEFHGHDVAVFSLSEDERDSETT